jgi:polyhydroxyalkanoate synthesis regulator phasin
MPKFWVYIQIHNQRQAIFDTDVELEELDDDELNEFIDELEETEEIDWTDVPSFHRREIEEIENESGEIFSVLILDDRIVLTGE